MNRKLSVLEQREYNLMRRVAMWRRNPQIMAEEYLGIKLFLYQKILIYLMNLFPEFMYIAARGQGKSYLIAVYAVIRCILYPETKIVIASGTKGQARLIITEKITMLYNNSAILRAEIKDLSPSFNDPKCEFHNGSKIFAVPSAETARGYRGNILILDEFRMIKKNTVDTVLKPFLNVVRMPPYMKLPKYKHLKQEPNVTIYISSAWYKNDWIWDEFNTFLKGLLKGGTTFVCDLPYHVSVFHRLLPLDYVLQEKTKDTFNQTTFDMEYNGLFIGETESSYFKLDPITKCRTLKKVFIPPTSEEFLEAKTKTTFKRSQLSNIPRKNFDSEIRLVSSDIALMGGSKTVKNDTATITCMRLLQDGNEYKRQVCYLESINESIDSAELAIKIKRIYYDFEADYVIVDTAGQGIGVFDVMCKTLYDEERDEEYEPWSCINDEEMNKRFVARGKPIIYSVKANASFNNNIAVTLKSVFEKQKIELPIDDIVKKSDLYADTSFLMKSPEKRQRQLSTFQQATALQNELIALEYKIQSGNIKIYETGKSTKDRYSSLAYANWYASELEKDLRRIDEESTLEDYLFGFEGWKG